MKYIVYIRKDYKNLIFIVDNFRPYNAHIFNLQTLVIRYNYRQWNTKRNLMAYLSHMCIVFQMDVECDSLEEVIREIPPELFL